MLAVQALVEEGTRRRDAPGGCVGGFAGSFIEEGRGLGTEGGRRFCGGLVRGRKVYRVEY